MLPNAVLTVSETLGLLVLQQRNSITISTLPQHSLSLRSRSYAIYYCCAVQLRAQAKQCLIKHDFEQAEQLLTQGLKLTPGSYKLYRLRSVAYACLQRYKESLDVSTERHQAAVKHCT